MRVVLGSHLQFMDLAVLNYQQLFQGVFRKWIARGITAISLPVFLAQRTYSIFPQCEKWCSSMVVVARKEKNR